MTTPTKKEFRWFWAWQDEQEEAWLREMSRQGWHMQSVALPGWYTFQLGAPADYAYRLDFIPSKEKTADYFTLFEDAGWEYLGEMNAWQYFRKAAVNGAAPEIFSDRASKAAKYRRVLGFMLIFVPILMINVLNLGRMDANGWLTLLEIINAALLLVYVYAGVQLWRRIRQLQQL